MVLTEEDQDKKVSVRNSDGQTASYLTYELVAVSDDVVESRLNHIRRLEKFDQK